MQRCSRNLYRAEVSICAVNALRSDVRLPLNIVREVMWMFTGTQSTIMQVMTAVGVSRRTAVVYLFKSVTIEKT